MRNNNIEWVIGQEGVKVYPLQPYSNLVIDFLDELSGILRQRAVKEKLPDVQSLAFWCRRAGILKMKERAADLDQSLGRGMIFHITPSNVPVNFAFSYFFGLLSGNANIVRLPSKAYRQVDVICQTIKELLEKQEYYILRQGTAFVRYGHDQAITDRLSAISDGRIIWGGDEAIFQIRRSVLKAKSVEIVFADRFSIGILDSDAVLKATDSECRKLAKQFYNDSYLMDQNACSSPHLLLWTGDESEKAKERFWNAVYKEARRYRLEPIKVVDKYTDLCMAAMEENSLIAQIQRWGNRLYTIEIRQLPEDICTLRGRFGMFYQYHLHRIEDLAPYITERVQTLLYYGIDRQRLEEFIMTNHLTGIDRIVPFGQSLEMNVYWDGYDIIRCLSRKITFL